MKKLVILLFVAALTLTVQAQKNLTIEETVLSRAKLSPNNLSQLQWITGTLNYSWVRTGITGEELVSSSGASKKANIIVTLEELNAKLISKSQTSLGAEPKFPLITWTDAQHFKYEARDYTVTYDTKNKTISTFLRPVYPAGAEHQDVSSANLTAYTVTNNLFIMKDGKMIQVTNDPNTGVVNGVSVHREEFGISKGTFWSPSGKQLAFYRMDQSMVTEYPIMELGFQPATARMIRYPMAGGASHHVTIGVYNSETGKTIFIQTGEPAEQYLTNIAWSPDNNSIYVAVLNREQNHMKFNRYNAVSGAFEQTLFEEKNEKWVQPMHPMVFLPGNPNEFIWESERDGYNAIYHYNIKGELIQCLTPVAVNKTKPSLIVTNVYGIDPKGTTVYFQATQAGNIGRTIYSVQIKKGVSSCMNLTGLSGTSNATFSSNYAQFICEYSDPATPKTVNIISNTGKSQGTIHTAENPLKDYTKCEMRLFKITAADGSTPLWCRMFMPAGFDSTKKYPSLTYVYNGPNVQLITESWLGGSDLFLYYMAQQGFVVFTVDGRGSDNRGLEFAQAIFRHLGTQEIADQQMGANYLKSKSWIDSKRMAVYGWSFGGFMTTSLMTRTPETYKCGVAGGAVTDWSMYEVMYTERYMDTPKENPEGYKEANTMNYVKNLTGKLLMIHGTSDDVVVWQHTLSYTKAAVDSGIQTDYYMYPGHLHNVRGKDRVHLLTKIAGYILANT